jgi:hypothetical protein
MNTTTDVVMAITAYYIDNTIAGNLGTGINAEDASHAGLFSGIPR